MTTIHFRGERPMTLFGVGYRHSVTLRPGRNEVNDADWSACCTAFGVAAAIENKVIEVVVSGRDGFPCPESVSNGGAAERPVEHCEPEQRNEQPVEPPAVVEPPALADLTVKEADKLVRRTTDEATLAKWLVAEQRESIAKIIRKRLGR